MELKQVTLAKLRKLVFVCKGSYRNCTSIKELDLVISDNPRDKKSYREKIKFIYTGTTHIYKLKQLKKYTRTMKDYKNVEIVHKWLEDKKNKCEKGDIIYIQGLIKFKGDKDWNLSFLQVCDNNEIAYKCISGVMIYEIL